MGITGRQPGLGRLPNLNLTCVKPFHIFGVDVTVPALRLIGIRWTNANDREAVL